MEFLDNFLTNNPFIPHGHCYLWKPGLVSLHIGSDFLIALAYYSIPISLVYFVKKRQDLPFNGIFLLFGAFIILCGTTHIMEVWTLWYPTYWLSGFLKAITAGVSMYTAMLVAQLIPQALAIPSIAQIEAANRQLASEITERKRIEEEVKKSYNLLRAVIEGTSNAIFVKDLEGRYLMINPVGADILGKPIEKIIGKNDTELLPPEIARSLMDNDSEILTGGETLIIEERINNRTYLSTKSVYRDSVGNVIGLIGIMRDITYRVQAEAALKQANEDLEIKVEQRTIELKNAIAQLQEEIANRKQVEAALFCSETRFRAAAEGSFDAFYIFESVRDKAGDIVDFKFVELNSHGAKLISLSREEIIGSNLCELLPINRTDGFFEKYKRVVETEVALQEEFSISAPGLTASWLHHQVVPLGDGIAITTRDITDRKIAEEALRKSEAQLTAILDNSPLCIYLKDTEGKFILTNRRLETLFHVKREEIKGKTDYDIFPHEIADVFRANDLKVLENGNPLELEEVAPQDDGLHTYISIKFPLYDAAGVAYAVCGISTDITDRKQIELEQLRLTNHIQLLLESTGEGIYGIDLQGRCTFINKAAAEMLGYQPDEVMGKNMHQVIHHSHSDGSPYPGEECPIFRTFRTGKSCHIDSEVLWRRDGTAFSAEYSSYPIVEGGEIKGTVVTFKDITEQQAALRERKQAETALGYTTRNLQEAQRIAHIGNWEYDILAQTITWSDEMYRIFSMEPGQPVPTLAEHLEAFHPDDRKRFQQTVEKAAVHGIPYEIDLRLLHPSGEMRHLEARAEGVRDNAGQVVRLIGTAIDITERKRAEIALREREQFLASIYDGVAHTIFVVDVGEDGEFRYAGWNQPTAQSIGISAASGYGKTPLELFGLELGSLVRQNYVNCLNAGKEVSYEESFIVEGAENWYLTTLTPLRDERGRIYRIVGTSVDISDRKCAEELLYRQAQLLQQVRGAVICTDLTGVVTSWSNGAEELYEYPATEALGRHISFIYPDRPEILQQKAIEPLLCKGQHEVEIKCLRKSGQIIDVFISLSLERDRAGNVIGLIGYSIDISDRKLAEAALRESEQRLSLALLGSASGLWDANLVKDEVYYSPEYKSILGYDADELEGNMATWQKLMHPDDVPHTMQVLNEHLADPAKPYTVDLRVQTKSGEWKWIQAHGKVVERDENGQPVRMAGTIHDISEQQAILRDRKLAEEALRQSEERYRSLILATSQIVWTTDGNGRVIDMPQWRAYTAQSESEVRGWGWLEAIHPDDRDRTAQVWNRAVETKSLYKTEYRIRAADGSYRYFSVSGVPVGGEDGSIREWIGICSDIDDRKMAEEALRESEEHFRATFEQAAVGICHCGMYGEFIKINQKFCDIVGYTEAELLKLSFADISHPDDAMADLTKFQALMAGKISTYSMEKRYITRRGETVWVNLTVSVVRSIDGEPKYEVAVIQDISDRKRAEEEQQKLVALVENSSDLIGLATFEGKLLFLNEAGQQLVGIEDLEEFNKQRTIFECLMPQDLAELQENILPVVMQRGRWEGEFRFRHLQTGRTIPVYYNVFTLKDPKTGQPIGLATVTRDITERKQAEEELQQSEARYRDLAQREELLNRLANQIRNSLELDTILETAVQEIRKLLRVDRCNFTWCRLHTSPPKWEIVKEARDADLPSFLGEYPIDPTDPFVKQVVNLELFRTDDAQNSTDPVQQAIYRKWGCPSMVVLPIKTPSGDVGLFSCVQHHVQHWNDWEVELLQRVADQLAIAISQAELYTQTRTRAEQLEQALKELKSTQAQLIQTEKMSSLGQLVAGIAHEINNAVNFIYGNISHAQEYTEELLCLVKLYQQHNPIPPVKIQEFAEDIDLDYLIEDLPKLLKSMKVGATRIRDIVLSLRNFSRLDEAEMKAVDIHEGIDSTLLILQNRLKVKPDRPGIEVIKEYGKLPLVGCYPGQLNQVFMNILANAIDAIEQYNKQHDRAEIEASPSTIRISTEIGYRARGEKSVPKPYVVIRIADNGIGMSQEVSSRIFDPFFTTKPIGSGTGLGMSISYQIVVEKHKGELTCVSAPGHGTEFAIEIPIGDSSLHKNAIHQG